MNQDIESETETKLNQKPALKEESETALEEEEIFGDLNDELKYEFDFEPGEEFKVVGSAPNYIISNHGRLYDLELSKFIDVNAVSHRVKVAVKDEVSPANPKVGTLAQLCSFSSFLDTIPNEEIDVKELTRLYNDFFNKSISTISFGKLKDVKNHFTKREVKRYGKFIKLYQKV